MSTLFEGTQLNSELIQHNISNVQNTIQNYLNGNNNPIETDSEIDPNIGISK